MMKKILSIGLFLLLFMSCEKDSNCDGRIAGPPPVRVYLQVVDQDTGIDVFQSGRFETSQVSITNATLEITDFQFIEKENKTLLSITLGWGNKTGSLSVHLGKQLKFALNYETKDISECYNTSKLTGLEVEGAEMKKITTENARHHYQILVP